MGTEGEGLLGESAIISDKDPLPDLILVSAGTVI